MKSTTAIILILVSIGLYYTAIGPQYSSVSALRDRKDQYTTILNNVTELKERRDALLAKYKAIPPSEVDRLDKVLPDRVDTINIARDFDTIAARYGISIKSLSTAEQKADNVGTIAVADASTAPGVAGQNSNNPTLQKLDITLSFIGTYPNFKKFLKDLESSIRIVDISNLTFNTTENGLNQYDMTLTTYWLK